MKFRQWILIMYLVFQLSEVRAQYTNSGTDFWFAFPEVFDDTNAVFAVNISSFVNTSGTVSVPGQGFSQSFSVVPGQVTRIVLPPPMVEILTSEILENKAVHVTANDNITVFAHTEHKFRNEATVILPVTSLGPDYYVLSYDPQSTNASEFLIVGQNTPVTVEITPSANTIGGNLAGVPFTAVINPGVAFQVQSTAGDLTGSRVRAVNSSDLFSVIGGSVFPNVLAGCGNTRDPLYEQLFPIQSWGTEYIFIPSPLFNEDVCRVIASQNGTNVSVNGTVAATLNAGQFYEFTVTSPILISGNNPIAAGRYLMSAGCLANPVTVPGSNLPLGDPALVVLNSNEQMFVDSVTFYGTNQTDIDSNYVQVITRTTDINNVYLDGTSIGPLFNIFAPDTFYSYATINIDTGSHTLTTSGCGFLAYVTGLGAAESFAYSAGVNTMDISSAFFVNNNCIQDTIQFFENSPGNPLGWLWDFGDGTISTDTNPYHIYSDTGKYIISLITTYNCMTDTLQDTVLVMSCGIITSINNDTVCNGNCTGLNVNVSGGIPPYTYLWSNGISNVDSIYVCPTGTTTYYVTVTDVIGSSSQTSAEIYVNNMPVANAGNDTIICFDGSPVTVVLNGSGGANYLWDTGDSLATIIVTPAITADYILTAITGLCSDTDTVSIILNHIPVAAFTTSNNCVYDTSFFSNNSTIASGSIASYNWDFGDGSLANSAINPFHLYGTDGLYTVTLIAISDSGCADTANTLISIYPDAQANFTTNNVCDYDSAYFMNTSTVSSGGITFNWDLGDGSIITQQNPVHIYGSYGTYTVTLIVSSDSGCIDSASKIISIHPVPDAIFNSNNNCLYDTSFFNNNSTIGGGSIVSYSWYFGDGSPASSATNPFHLYGSEGLFTATLIAVSDSGCTDTASTVIEKYPAPQIDFTPTSVCLQDSTQFTNLTTINSGSITNWIWSFEDGSPLSFQQHPVHLFSLGQYNVLLIAISDKGCKDTLTKQVGVYPLPTPDFSYANKCLNKQPVLFSDSTTILSPEIITSWQWEMGDGSIYQEQNPSHTYSSEGIYTVSLIASSYHGCRDTFRRDVEIYPVPLPDFQANVTAGCEPLCVEFSDESSISSGTISGWLWESGIFSGILSDPEFCYENVGNYTVSLITVSDKGCRDTITKNDYIVVYPLPVADFSYYPQSTTVQNMHVFFIDFSSGNISQWEWLFFDNDSGGVKSTSFAQNPDFDFSLSAANSFVYYLQDTGYYPVQLIVMTENGCKDTIAKKVKVDGVFYVNIPNAFTPNGDGKNDYFFPSGIGIEPYKDFNFYIYNRWGDLIFFSQGLDDPWDGTAREQGGTEVVQQDVYVWAIELKETTISKKHQYLGHVTLLK